MLSQTENFHLLLVEDSPEDVELTTEALKSQKLHVKVHVVNDGLQALDFLNKSKGYKEAPTPDLVMLDLNLPKKDGRAVLAEIKADEDLRQIPVVVLTTSTSPQDIYECYENHANSYVAKPVDFDRFVEAVANIESFWFKTAKLPA